MRLISYLLLLAAWLLAARPALAQAPAAPAALRIDSLAAPAPDTAAALHRYFARRRHNGHVSLGVGAGLLAAGTLTAVVGGQQGSWVGLGYVVLGAAGAVVSLPIAVRGIVLMARHSEMREQRAVEAWQQRRLPNRLARRALNPALTWDENLQ